MALSINAIQNLLSDMEAAKHPVATVHVEGVGGGFMEAAIAAAQHGGEWIHVTSDEAELMHYHFIHLSTNGYIAHHYSPGTEYESVIKATDKAIAMLPQWTGGE